jgi:D-ribulokinase
MDHRAMKETDEINATQDEVLQYVGGAVSPEMEIPKILWLKRNMPE